MGEWLKETDKTNLQVVLTFICEHSAYLWSDQISRNNYIVLTEEVFHFQYATTIESRNKNFIEPLAKEERQELKLTGIRQHLKHKIGQCTFI